MAVLVLVSPVAVAEALVMELVTVADAVAAEGEGLMFSRIGLPGDVVAVDVDVVVVGAAVMVVGGSCTALPAEGMGLVASG